MKTYNLIYSEPGKKAEILASGSEEYCEKQRIEQSFKKPGSFLKVVPQEEEGGTDKKQITLKDLLTLIGVSVVLFLVQKLDK